MPVVFFQSAVHFVHVSDPLVLSVCNNVLYLGELAATVCMFLGLQGAWETPNFTSEFGNVPDEKSHTRTM